MKFDIPAPIERLGWFQSKLGLDGEELEKIKMYKNLFVNRKEAFAERFFQYFNGIMETRIILEHEKRQGQLKKALMQWFASLFEENCDQRFMRYVWKSGLRHVELNIDQRYINLGYSLTRQFCQKVCREGIPRKDLDAVLVGVDKIIDLCILIETHAYIAATSQCDMEVVKGISHQVRNPLTVIGGNILRLKKRTDPGSSIQGVYDTILGENRRLEGMVSDVVVYSQLFEKEADPKPAPIEDLITRAVEKLKKNQWVDGLRVEMDLDPDITEVEGDPEDLEIMFYYLLQNSLEAVDPTDPYIRISSRHQVSDSPFVQVEIFNKGPVPEERDVDNLFVPFFSTKPFGTGLGLAIARLAARKSLGEVHLEPIPSRGTVCIVELPIPAG
jgi:signal transduction histidine kinase